jgi:hypothetical protein
MAFRAIAPCTLLGGFQIFDGAYCLRLLPSRYRKQIQSLSNLIITYHTEVYHNIEDHSMNFIAVKTSGMCKQIIAGLHEFFISTRRM